MKWFWDQRRRLYVTSNGDPLSAKELREALEDYIVSTQLSMAAEVVKYSAGKISISTLFNSLNEEISALHGASGSLAYGGLNQMDLGKWARVNERLQSELGYLSRFQMDVAQAANIVTHETPLSVEAVISRADLYAEAAYGEYANQVLGRERDNGVTLGRRISEKDAASCDECIDAATDEFVPLDELEEIGSLQCLSRCRCEFEFSADGTEFATSELFGGVVQGQENYGGSITLQ